MSRATGNRPGRRELTAAETVAPSVERAAAWCAAGRPWCDSCGMPAVFTRGGWRHADRWGGALAPLPGGHRVTAADWHEVGPLVDVAEWTPMFPVASVAYH